VRALLHPHGGAVGRAAHQVHGLGGQAQHARGATLHRGQAPAIGSAHGQLLVAPGATAAGGAQGQRQVIQRGRGIVGGQGPGRGAFSLLI